MDGSSGNLAGKSGSRAWGAGLGRSPGNELLEGTLLKGGLRCYNPYNIILFWYRVLRKCSLFKLELTFSVVPGVALWRWTADVTAGAF